MSAIDFNGLDTIVHGSVRLGVITALAADGSLDFTTLVKRFEVADGAMGVHLRKLNGKEGQSTFQSGLNSRRYDSPPARRKEIARQSFTQEIYRWRRRGGLADRYIRPRARPRKRRPSRIWAWRNPDSYVMEYLPGKPWRSLWNDMVRRWLRPGDLSIAANMRGAARSALPRADSPDIKPGNILAAAGDWSRERAALWWHESENVLTTAAG